METNDHKLCKRCEKPVEENIGSYDVFEQMHWLCFHLEFEHDGDPDRPCGDPSCPWWHIAVFERKLREVGIDPKLVIADVVNARWGL